MQAAHAARARVTGSLGVGKFYFRIMTADRRFFELYYDRTIKNAHARGGSWVLYREIFNYRDPEK
jgi:hypothetical protein